MKIYFASLVFFLMLFISACKEENRIVPDIYWGEVTALKNGEPWKAEIRAAPESLYGYGFNISAVVYKENVGRVEGVSIFRIPLKEQYNTIGIALSHADTVSTGSSYSLSDDDVLLAYYYVLEKENFINYVHVTSYDSASREVGGEFEIAYLETRVNSIPDTVRFTNGKFYTRIVEINN